MSYSLFDHMDDCSEAEVQRLLPLVSPQRREAALRFKFTFGQYACLKAYELLQQLLAREGYVAAGEPLLFVENEHGKPSLSGRADVHFSISHCKAAIAVAVDRHPVGIDVERLIAPSDSLLRYCMSDAEVEQVRQSAHPDQEFTALWTRKEALFKLRGTGITDDIRQLLEQPDPAVRLRTRLFPAKGYVFSLAETIAPAP